MKRWASICLLLFSCCFLKASTYDSLLNALHHCSTDTARANTLNKLGRYFQRVIAYDSAQAFAQRELDLSKRTGYRRGEAQAMALFASVCFMRNDLKGSVDYREKAANIYAEIGDSVMLGYNLSQIGSSLQDEGDFKRAEEYNKRSLLILRQQNAKKFLPSPLLNLGAIAFYHGDYKTALDYYMQALQIVEEIKDERQAANALIDIGNVYNYQKNYDQAYDMYSKALEKHQKRNDEYGIAVCLLNMGELLALKKKPKDALDLFDKTLAAAQKINHPEITGLTLYNIGSIYGESSEHEKALEYYRKALEIQQKMGDQPAQSQTMNDIGNVLRGQKKYGEAKQMLQQALAIALRLQVKENIMRSYSSLADLYEELGDYRQALDFHKKYADIKDSILNEETNKHTAEMVEKYEGEKKDREIELLNKGKALQDIQMKEQKAESDKKETQRNAFLAGSILLLLLSLFIFRGYRQKQKDNRIIEAQKAEVEEKNKDITDSINYAQLIQEAILPAKEIKYRLFPEAFVLFRPRDIVSGDFYWFGEKNGKKLIAAVDCTGHGVPGAFMSMIGNAFLNQLVIEQGITEPGKVLDELRSLIIRSLRQSGAEGENRDGMDIALLSFDEQNTCVEFAGANNPLWHFRGDHFTEIKGEKQPIGYQREEAKPYATHRIALQKGDRLYIFTDGYPDQFGGEQGKKFKYRQFQELLASAGTRSMPEQENLLLERFSRWKGRLEQVDDVLVIGIKV